MYNWLGVPANKEHAEISQNLSRNLTGALMQDYLIHLVIALLEPYPALETFTEVRVPFGIYPLWEHGDVIKTVPIQVVDLAIGYRLMDEIVVRPEERWPQPVIYRLAAGEIVLPLTVVNSKIRVSQSEFFDFLGREELLTKGNPDCLSIQVALRSEMNLKIVDAAQASNKFFLLGRGREDRVAPNPDEIVRLTETISDHLRDHMI